MKLLEALRYRWAADAALTTLLAVDRVSTGPADEASIPYAVITRQTQRPVVQHNDAAAIESVRTRIDMFHDNYDSGWAIAQQIKRTYDRTQFDIANNDRVIDMRRADESDDRDDDGIWRFTIDFDITVYLENGS